MRLTKSKLSQIIKEELSRKLLEQAQDQGDVPGSRADQQREIWGTSDEDLEREQIQAQADERGITFEEMEVILADLNSPERRRRQDATNQAQARATAQDQGNWPEPREVSLDSIDSENDLGNTLYSTFWKEVCSSGAVGGPATQYAKYCGLGNIIRTTALDPGEDNTYPNLVNMPPEIDSGRTVVCSVDWAIDINAVGDRVQCSIAYSANNIAPGSRLEAILNQSVQAINAASVSFSSSLIIVDEPTFGTRQAYPMSDGLPNWSEALPDSVVSLVGSGQFKALARIMGGPRTRSGSGVSF